MKKIILSLGVVALFGATITLSWADKLNYGSTLNGIVAGQPASAADVRGAFNAVKTAIDGCPADMVKVATVCVDKYEAHVTTDAAGTTAAVYTDCNVNGSDCSIATNNVNITPAPIYANSLPNKTPSVGFTWFQAQQACANVGKRLLTNAEWQMAAAGTPDDAGVSCNVNNGGTLEATGSNVACISNYGAYDMVGNVNEWVADWVQGSGTVAANNAGLNTAYGSDNIVAGNAANQGTNSNGMPAAMIRGGSAATGATAAGVFFLLTNGAPSLENDPVTGFRCAR